MKVLLVSHAYPPFGVAGVERLSAQTAEALTAAGHEVTVLTRRPSAAPPTLALERETRDGVPVVTIAGGGMAFEQFPTDEAAVEGIFERVLAEVVPDVVLVTHLMHHAPGYVGIAHRWRIPVVLELHDFFALCPRAHLQRTSGELCPGPEGGRACAKHCFDEQPDAELRWALRCQTFSEAVRDADEVIAPSRFVAEAFAPLRDAGAPIRVLDSPVAELGPVVRSKLQGELHLASIGVTVEHKGFQVVIEALRRAELPASRYTVFGVPLPPLAGELREAAEQVPGLELQLFGEFSPEHLPALLADADLLVVPSLVPETYSIVAREGFACGLPVIASEIGALPDAIRPGENGWLFEPGDVFGLATLLRRLDEDRSLVRRAANGIRPTDITRVAERTARLEKLLEGLAARPVEPTAPDRGAELRQMREALADADADRRRAAAAGR